MNRQEAMSQYATALKQGRKAYKEALVRGRYPYPQVLDEIISDSMVAGQTELGVMEIPIDQIVGTKTAVRLLGGLPAPAGPGHGVCREVDQPLRGPPGGRGHPGPYPVL